MIKKINILLACSFVLSACSFFGSPAPAATNISTLVFSPTPTFTITPTRLIPTFTSTPTLTGIKSPTPTLVDTVTPTPTATGAFDNVTLFTPTPVVKMDGFLSIKTSSTVFYKGEGCGPTSVKFTAVTVSSTEAEFVVLFTRFVSKTSGAKSEWTSITIESDGLGKFTHDLVPLEMKAVDAYADPWVQFQFVSTDKKSVEVGRTDIFDEQLSLLACVSTPTPTVTVTPTVLKP